MAGYRRHKCLSTPRRIQQLWNRSNSQTAGWASPERHFFQPVRYIDVPAQLACDGLLEPVGRLGFAVNEKCFLWGRFECAQPAKQFFSICVVAELLQRGYLGADG